MEEQTESVKLPAEQLVFLERCAALELKMAELYQYYARLFAGYQPLVQLWEKTAREEENHARQFQLGTRLKGIGMRGLVGDLARAQEYLGKVEDFLADALTRHPTAVDALTQALEMEKRVATLHMSSVVLFDDPELKKLFQALMRFDDGHVACLEECLEELKSKNLIAELRYTQQN